MTVQILQKNLDHYQEELTYNDSGIMCYHEFLLSGYETTIDDCVSIYSQH